MRINQNDPFFKKVLNDILHTLKNDKSYDLNGAVKSLVSVNCPNLNSQEFTEYLKAFKKAAIEEQNKEVAERKDREQVESELESLEDLKNLRDRIKELLANRDFEGGVSDDKEEEKERLVKELKRVSALINQKEGDHFKIPLR